MEELKYPIGKWKSPDTIDKIRCSNWINDIKDLPNQLKSTLSNINENDLQRKYRPEGWTIQQVVHHIADSHMNAYIRHKLSTTEDTPTINPYNEKLWSEMLDVKMLPIDVSLNLIENLHLPDGCQPQIVDALLCPTPRDGYQSRLFFSVQITGQARNWNGNIRVLERNWFAISWQVPPGLRLYEILLVHLRSLR